MEWVYILLYICTVFALPICIVLMVFGVNPLSWFLVSTWNTPYSVIEYLIFILLALMISFYHTFDHAYSYTVSIVAAGAAGYLYEVPYWLSFGGWAALFRTARYSWIILDWGMLCVPFMIYFLTRKQITVKPVCYAASLFYVFYAVVYYMYPYAVKRFLYYGLGLIPIIGIRIPGMVLLLCLINSICREKEEMD